MGIFCQIYLFYFDSETISGVGGGLCFEAATKKGQLFGGKSASGDLARGFCDLEMTWLTALAFAPDNLPHDLSDLEMTWLP